MDGADLGTTHYHPVPRRRKSHGSNQKSVTVHNPAAITSAANTAFVCISDIFGVPVLEFRCNLEGVESEFEGDAPFPPLELSKSKRETAGIRKYAMDATLQAQRSLTSCGFTDCANQLSVRPALELCTYRPITPYLQSHSWRIKCPTGGGLHQVSASSDFSKRRPRKGSSSRARGSGPTSKGYVPKAPAGTGTHKGNKKTSGDDGNAATSTSVPHEKTPEKRGFSEGRQETVPNAGRAGSQSGNETNGKVIELSQGNGQLGGDGRSRLKQNSSIQGNHEGGSAAVGDDRRSPATLQYEPMTLVESGCVQKSSTEVGNEEESVLLDENERHLLSSVDDQKGLVTLGEQMKSVAAAGNNSASGYASVEEGSERIQGKNIITSEQQIETGPSKIDAQVLKAELSRHPDDALAQRDEDDHSKKLKLELEAQRLRQVVEELAEAAFLAQNKLFTHPQLVKPGEDIEVFFNRSLSPLRGEPNVSIMGAHNDWRWKSFTIKMDKSKLNGDWWSCKIRVPEEAYTIDFVFFNGENVYDNNNKNDFHITVEGGMDAVGFEDYLLGEKRREHEKLARAQADKERQEEEQRRIEEEAAAIESHRAQAKADVQSRRTKLQPLIKKAAKYVVNLWHLETREIEGENLVRLYYNRSSGPLALANEIWIHGGINNWRDGLSICAKLEKSEKKDADWWYTVVSVPDEAFVLDWVFADGAPHKAVVYDNNNYQDFHAIMPKSISEEQYWAEEEERIFQKLQQERMEMMEAMRANAEKTARLKAKAKEKALKRFLMSRKHIVYTEPLDVRAGGNVTVYYNPSNTVLRGKPEVWFRCSFNRWAHHKGPLLPQKMVPVENVSHVKTTVKVPLDAYIMDFVFSEKEDGGIFDNNNGVDYHVPVFGGIIKEPPMHIVHIAVEMAPIAKVGGLGDVVTSLSRAVKDLNHHVDIILPKYDCLNLSNVKDLQCTWSYHWGGTEIKVWYGKVEGLPVYFLEPCNGFFWTGCIYGCRNDAERFGFFSHAALEFLQQNGLHPDIIHCHDWSSAPVAWLYKDHYQQYGLGKARVVFTIHNLEFGAPLIGKAMEYSDKATTVSPTYSMEVAANPVIAPNILKFHGIINGIDPDIWDPYNDKFLPVSYTSENVIEGKRAAKEALQKKLGLKVVDVPLVGVISRLTQQKGIHLIKHAIWRTLECGGQFILLGSAPDPRIQIDFVNLANQLHSTHGDCAHLCLTYDEPLSHLIYAAADLILVPSVFEPCGLTQLVAMRYGAVPVVRKTGGLYDTVFDVDHDKERAEAQGLQPNGFNFEGADAPGVDYALNRAISAWYDRREWFDALCKRVMEQDWSWNGPALGYLELYHAARKN